ncbi:MAG TPA: hypothetical protein VM165_24700 [Planctomycetaceae bacterium]|nr:hypothetical protein [Planctomycetaceae bacterium]
MKQRLKILIAVKTYPIPSAKYGELVCTAGVTENGDFVRLYPINFRDQPYSKQYRKYQWIEVDAEKYQGRDTRKESYRPDCDTLSTVGEQIPTKQGDWSARAEFVLKNVTQSMEELRERQDQDATSLGIIRPKIVNDLVVEPADREWKRSFLEELRQARLWDDRTASKEPPRKIPYKFQYVFHCDDERCTGHQMMNEDWELGQLYWNLIDRGASESEAVEKVREKFFVQMCGPDRQTYFFVGTILAHPKSWVVIGTFWPKARQPSVQKLVQKDLF